MAGQGRSSSGAVDWHAQIEISGGGVDRALGEGTGKILDTIVPLVQQETALTRECFGVPLQQSAVMVEEDEAVACDLLEGVESELKTNLVTFPVVILVLWGLECAALA